MADIVQNRLERMVPELEDLERRSLFTKREINEIVKTRTKFEYRLQRPSPLKQDFLDYIDYEKQLDRLRVLRKKAVSRELKEKGNKKMKKSVSDFAGVRRIIEIYRMATSRFKGDLKLWFQFLEFCKEKKNGTMKRALAQVIRFHPKKPAVWVYAAAWQFDHNLDAQAARATMLNGLRACPHSEDLWVEYLRMELTYLNKLKMRKVMLGEDDGTLVLDNKDAEEKQWQDENKELFMSLEENKEGGKGVEVSNEDSNRKLDIFRDHGMSILRTVYKNAVDALPSNFNLRKRFLEIVEATDLAHSEEIQNEILADMKRDFSQEPEYWDWLARLKMNDPQSTPDIGSESGRCQVDEVIKVYEEAIKLAPSIVMFDMYIKFLMSCIIPQGEEMQDFGLSSASNSEAKYTSQLLKVFEKAETMGCLSEDLACQHIKFYLHMGKFDEAMKLAERFCDGRFSDSVLLWVLRATEHMKMIKKCASSRKDLSSVIDLLKKMVKKAAVSGAESVWVMALELFADDKKYFNKLLDLSLVSLAKDGGTDNGFSLPATLVDFVCEKNGIQQARELYKRLINLPHPGLAFYKHCIELEISTNDKNSLANARKLFECALTTYSEDISLWQKYYSMEREMGTSETTNAVYWRAKKTLGDASVITAQSLQ